MTWHPQPWEGPAFCGETTKGGTPCASREIEGLERCLHHMPDDLLDEAEQITGIRRCRHGWGTPDPTCVQYAVAGTDPPACKVHGANQGSNTYRAAAGRVVESRTQAQIGRILSEHGQRLLRPPPLGDPLAELLAVAAEMRAFHEIAREMVAYLRTDQWRYERKTVGEQVRAEILVYERSLERFAAILLNIARLHIDVAQNRIEAAQAVIIQRALEKALQRAGTPLEGQHVAIQVLRAELTAA